MIVFFSAVIIGFVGAFGAAVAGTIVGTDKAMGGGFWVFSLTLIILAICLARFG